jgi:SAM-dependent methyltransferase
MHQSAYKNCQKFRDKYLTPNHKSVLDIGSYNVNGCLKPLFPNQQYTGLDMQPGPNVDIVFDGGLIPLYDNTYDLVISSSCFEHAKNFWNLFNEAVRVAKPQAYLYICAPSQGPYHGYPTDCWRFMLDSWKALEHYNKQCKLLESYIDTQKNYPDGSDIWQDSVGIYQKM